MGVTHASGVRNSLANVVGDAHDAGAGTAVLRLRDGATPLVDYDLANPAFDTAPATAAGVITCAGLPIDAVGIGAGEADNFVTLDRNGAQVLAGSVTATGMGGDIEVTNTNIAVDQDCSLDSLTYTASV